MSLSFFRYGSEENPEKRRKNSPGWIAGALSWYYITPDIFCFETEERLLR
jgi:hypothetical protein